MGGERGKGSAEIKADTGATSDDAAGDLSRQVQTMAEGKVWQNQGGDLADVRRRAMEQQQQQYVSFPIENGMSVRIHDRTKTVDVVDQNNRPVRGVQRGALNNEGVYALPFTLGEGKQYVVRLGTSNAPYQLEAYNSAGRIMTRQGSDGSWDKYDPNTGRPVERSINIGNQNIHLKHSADGKVDSYEIAQRNQQGQLVIVEKGSHQEGKLKVERVDDKGVFKPVDLKDRTAVTWRDAGKLEFLDKDGFGYPDSAGRSFKQSDYAVPVKLADGTVVPINPVEAIRNKDGSRTDFELNERLQPKKYTVKDAQGKVIETGEQNKNGWNISKWDGKEMKRVTDPATKAVALDHLTGRQINYLANGEALVRSEFGEEFIAKTDPKTGETIEKLADGRTRRRATDSNEGAGPWDRTVTTKQIEDGRHRVEKAHMRSMSDLFLDVKYGADGKTPTELMFTKPGQNPVRMRPDPSDAGKWIEERPAADGSWKATGTKIAMKVEMAGENTTVGGPLGTPEKVMPGSLIITMNPDDPKAYKATVINADGTELEKYRAQDGSPVRSIHMAQQPVDQGDPRMRDQGQRRGSLQDTRPRQVNPWGAGGYTGKPPNSVKK